MFATFAGTSLFPSFSVLHLIHVILTDIFSEKYHFSTGIGGLAYLGMGVGFLVATLFGVQFADRVYKHVSIRFHAKK